MSITLNLVLRVKKMAAFLNEFDMTCRHKLATLREKLTMLERRLDYLEARLTSTANKAQSSPAAGT